MVDSFYVYLNSNADVLAGGEGQAHDTEKNNTSRFTVRFPNKFEFNAKWSVALVSIMYPYSWPNMGTSESQYIDVVWKDGIRTRLYIKSAAYRTVELLEQGIKHSLRSAREGLCLVTRGKRAAGTGDGENVTINEKRARAEKPATEAGPASAAEHSLPPEVVAKLDEMLRAAGVPTMEDIEAERAGLQRRIKKLNEQIVALEAQKQADAALLTSRLQQIQRLEVAKVADELELRTLRALKTEYESFKTTKERESGERAREIDALKRQVSEAQARLRELTATHATELATERTKREAAEAQLKGALATIQNYEARVARVEQRMSTMSATKDAAAVPAPTVTVPDGCTPVRDARFEKLMEYLKVDYEPSTQRFVLKINTAQIGEVHLSEELQYILGFDRGFLTGTRTVAPYMPDIYGGIHALYIYSPQLVEPSVVSDSTASILRIVKVKGKPGDMVEEEFLSPQYHKLLERNVGQISIEIRTSTAAGRELGKEGLAAGSRILGNVAEGKNLRSAVVDETATGLRNLVGRADLNEGVRGIIDQAQRRLQGGRGRRRGAITRRGTRQKRAIIAKRHATDRLPRGLLSL
ncbi:Protein Y57G11C.20 [Aphelenchoides avenae]|nr:Protein Y57G11C.20 [Aphelenchus avenae]